MTLFPSSHSALAQHNGDLNAAAEWLFENAERLAHEDAASGETTAAQDCEVASVIGEIAPLPFSFKDSPRV